MIPADCVTQNQLFLLAKNTLFYNNNNSMGNFQGIMISPCPALSCKIAGQGIYKIFALSCYQGRAQGRAG
jgi:amino acid permease